MPSFVKPDTNRSLDLLQFALYISVYVLLLVVELLVKLYSTVFIFFDNSLLIYIAPFGQSDKRVEEKTGMYVVSWTQAKGYINRCPYRGNYEKGKIFKGKE